jgi:fermentation-respiration switch protein FrsA (DUF1100 family)
MGYWLRMMGVMALMIVLTQDLQIYPEIWLSKLEGGKRGFVPPLDGARDGFARTEDGGWVSFRRWPGRGAAATPYRVAILHHGNLGTMDGYRRIPEYLAGLGITSYVFDYRGYGKSFGWPSERNVYADSEAVYAKAREIDGVRPEETIAFAHSIGGGAASRLAARHGLGVLWTAGTFESLREQAHTHFFFWFFSPWVQAEYPVRGNVSRLAETCFVQYHGEEDETVPLWMARRLAAAYRGSGGRITAYVPGLNHNGILDAVTERGGGDLRACAAIRAEREGGRGREGQ